MTFVETIGYIAIGAFTGALIGQAAKQTWTLIKKRKTKNNWPPVSYTLDQCPQGWEVQLYVSSKKSGPIQTFTSRQAAIMFGENAIRFIQLTTDYINRK